jgi:long-chain acyl-CoA synthetase
MSAGTIPGLLAAREESDPTGISYWRRDREGHWQGETWRESASRVRTLSHHLRRLGLREGDAVILMMPTTPEWEYCHLAVLSAGGVVVGVDAHDAPDNIRHIVRTVRPRLLILNTLGQLETWRDALTGDSPIMVVREPTSTENVHALDDLLVGVDDRHELPSVSPDMAATVIFTSGSTGRPKGITYTHGQLVLATRAILSRFPGIRGGARLACWLPMSNLFQRIINLCAMACGAQCFFVESPAEIIKLLPSIRPVLFIGVPRFYEKLYAGIMAEIAKRPAPVRGLVMLAWGIGARYQAVRRRGRRPGVLLEMAHGLAEAVVLRRLRGIMGPDLRFMVSGSAPMPPWLMEKLHGMGLLVLEAYGISECVVPIAIGAPDGFRFGSVGRPLPENEAKLAEDSELLVRGAGVFRGYLGDSGVDSPLDSEGYLHTGDFARFDDEGYLWLTGRKSEIFKTSTGRRIAPTPIEACLKQLPYVEHAVVFGRNRPFPVALLCVNDALQADSPAALKEKVGHDAAQVCEELTAYQRPAGFLISRRGFSIADGELTSNLKLRRTAIEDRNRENLDALYAALAGAAGRDPGIVLEIP